MSSNQLEVTNNQSNTMIRTLSIPNIPGMSPSRSTWLQRETSGEGFRRSSSISRPSSAVEKTSLMYNRSDIFNQRTQRNEFDKTRPSTAGGARTSYVNEELDKVPRPATASSAALFGRRQADVPVKLPRYVETDKQVARFWGHFYAERPWDREGPLGQTAIEGEICRKFVFYYYIYDDTVEIFEPRNLNSGMPQGMFYRRGRLLLDNSSQPVRLTDLAPGNTLRILGREFTMTDADTFTRDLFKKELGIDLSHPLMEPGYMSAEHGAMYATGLGSPDKGQSKANFNACSTDYLALKEGLDKVQRFLKYDGQILRFLCVEVRHLHPPYFPHVEREMAERGEDLYSASHGHGFVASASAKQYALSFYLASLEIDVVAQKRAVRDQGDDEPPTIMKKCRLARNWREAKRGRPPQFYDATDFRCGEIVDVYGRLFLLVGCDAFTHDYYREKGLFQTEVPLVAPNKVEIVQPVPRQGDGFIAIGSAEDTLATVYGKPPVRKDQQKLARNQGRLLRARAEMVTTNPVDLTREFFITYYLEDDTVQVFEEVKRNSGVWGGNFLKRGKYMNEDAQDSLEPRRVRPTDIFLGNVICLNGCKFHIIEMDNMSLQFCETNPQEFPHSDIQKIVGEVMQIVKAKNWDVRALFGKADSKKSCILASKVFIDLLEENGLTNKLLDQEVLTLLRRFSDSKENVYYPEFCDMVSHLYYQSYLRGRQGAQKGELLSFSNFISTARGRSIQWRRQLRQASGGKNSLSLSSVMKVFQKNGITLSDNIVAEVVKRYVVGGVAHPKPPPEEVDDLDQMVAAKETLRKQSGLKAAMAHATNMAAKIAELRKKNPLGRTSTMRRSKSWAVTPNLGDIDMDSTIIDFHRLCDDIYVSDWL